MRISNYILVIGMSALMVSGCSYCGKCRIARMRTLTRPADGFVSKIGLFATGVAAPESNQCSCAVCTENSNVTTPTLISTSPIATSHETTTKPRDSSIFEYRIQDASDEAASELQLLPESEQVPNQIINDQPLSSSKSSRFYYLKTEKQTVSASQQKPDPNQVLLSEELYTSSPRVANAMPMREYLSEIKSTTATDALPAYLTSATSNNPADDLLQLDPHSQVSELAIELENPATELFAPTNDSSTEIVEGKSAEIFEGKANEISESKPTEIVEGKLSIPHAAVALAKHKRDALVPIAIESSDTAPVISQSLPPTATVLQARTDHQSNFLDSLTRKAQERDRGRHTNESVVTHRDSLLMEPVNFRKLPSIRPENLASISPHSDSKVQEFGLATNMPQPQERQDIVPSQPTRLPATTSSGQPLMLHASYRKPKWETVPKVDSLTRAQQDFQRAQQNRTTAELVEVLPSYGILRLHAIPVGQNVSLPPIVNINRSLPAINGTLDGSGLPTQDTRQQTADQQTNDRFYRNSEAVRTKQNQADDSIRRLTVRPTDSQEPSGTIER